MLEEGKEVARNEILYVVLLTYYGRGEVHSGHMDPVPGAT